MVDDPAKISALKLADSSNRKIWIALLMGIIFPGLAQLYNGQIRLAFIIMLAITVSHVLITIPDPDLPLYMISINYLIYILALVYGTIKTAKNRDGYITEKWNNWAFYMLFLMVGIIFTSLPNGNLYDFHSVENACMGDKYNREDILYVNKTDYFFDDPVEEDIVLFRSPFDPKIRSIGRIWAKGPCEIVIKDNAVYLDGYLILSSRLPKEEIPQVGVSGEEMMVKDSLETVDVPQGSYLVIGDNSFGWADETCAGVVPENMIEGRVKYRFMKYSEDDETRDRRWRLLFFYLFLQ